MYVFQLKLSIYALRGSFKCHIKQWRGYTDQHYGCVRSNDIIVMMGGRASKLYKKKNIVYSHCLITWIKVVLNCSCASRRSL